MAKHYICDNPNCKCTFQIEEADLYCKKCTPTANAWQAEQKQRMAENAEQFAKDMMDERKQFFQAKTPKTQGEQPQQAAVVTKAARGSGGSKQTRN